MTRPLHSGYKVHIVPRTINVPPHASKPLMHMCEYVHVYVRRPCARVVRVVHSCRGAWRSEAREGAGAALAACVGFVRWGRILSRLSSTIGRQALNGRGYQDSAHKREITSQMLCVCAMLGQAGVRSLSGVLFGPAVSCAEGARVGRPAAVVSVSTNHICLSSVCVCPAEW